MAFQLAPSIPPDKVLLVEGAEDRHAIGHLLDIHGYHEGCEILDFQGYERVLSEVKSRIRVADQSVIGIVVDADVNLVDRWKSIETVLSRRGYAKVPRSPIATGTTIAQQGKPTIGIWIMPDNASAGMLEDFAARLLPLTDALWPRAVSAVDSIPPAERLFANVHLSKANLKTWLAWQEEPGMPIGLAIKKGALDANAPAAVALKDWLVDLLDLKPEPPQPTVSIVV